MRVEASLRRRVLAACMLLAAIVGGVFAAATYVLIESVEHELIDRRLNLAMEPLLSGWRNGTAALPPTDLRFIAGQQLPPALRRLPPGLHELELEGRGLRVLLVDAAGERFALIDDQSDFERIERIAYGVLALAFVAGVLLALGIGRALDNRILAPLSTLALAVQRDELALVESLSQAPDEIGLLARSFRQRTLALQKALERERLFTADASHELRTPLSAVLGAAELLASRLETEPALQAMAERIRRNAADMAARVTALLQLARLPDSAKDWPVVDLRIVARRELERCAALLQGKPVRAELDAPLPLYARVAPELAAVAIDNLLRNAGMFTLEGRICLRLRAHCIEVEDSGPGLPEAVRQRLADGGAGASSPSQGGSGLGLSLVQRVAERLGWRLEHEALAAGGSCFRLWLDSSLRPGP